MDRQFVYDDSIGQVGDVLWTNKNTMIALGYALEGAFGSGTSVQGLACTPTGPASMIVNIARGAISIISTVDPTAYGDLGTDTHVLVKQGLSLATVPLTLVAPSTSGFSQVFLVQVAYTDTDGGSQVLSYYNSLNPSSPYAGPGNAGTSNFTVRKGVCNVGLKAGTAATTGTQTTPAPDAGFIGLYAITVANAQTTITSPNIVQLTTSPFFPTLPQVPTAVQNNQWIAGTAGGSVNAYTLTTFPPPPALVAGQEILVNFTTPNTSLTPTLNRDGLGVKNIIKLNGTALSSADLAGWLSLIYDGTSWRCANYVPSDVLQPVTANVTLYVRTDGNDANNGSANNAGNAFLTIQAAYNYALQRLSFGGFTLTIQLGNTGTYSGPVTCAGGIVCTIKGDAAAQASYIISGVPPSALQGVINCGTGSTGLIGLKIVNSTTTTGFGSIISCGSGSVSMSNVTVASGTNTTGYGISCGNGTISIGTGCIFQCSCANSVLLSEYGGLIGIGANMAVPVALSVGQFALSFGCGTIAWSVPGYVFTGAGVAGTVGQRYSCQLNGTINTGGGGASVFPGNSAGAVSTGGQYQ